MTSNEPSTHLDRVTRSMLWSAWADALGFITERTTPEHLRKRVGGSVVTSPVEWTRRVGGRFGVDMVLPAGTYSDDTQLRLATSRAISGAGFDAEAFAKVDLVVWPSYALGGGRASKAAAANMAKVSVPWFGNFFDGYLSAGGNGVAMRIQPHVWASFDSASDPKHLVDLLRDGVITHGHPRALVGAVLHAVALGRVMTTGQPLTEADWQQVLTKTERTAMLIEQDESLATVWLPYWENATGSQLSAAWAETVTECAEMLDAIRPSVAELKRSPDPKIYEQIITALDLRNPENVGSGTATAVAALAVSTAVPDPETASRLTANALGTDTDTIGTMVGAVCGASASAAPPSSVQDSGYLRKEAARLSDIATKRGTSGFNYADLLTWVAPNSQIDSVGLVQEQMALAGMAFLQPDSERKAGGDKQAVWEWVVSDFGQSFLIKRRLRPKNLPDTQWPAKERYVTVTPTWTSAVERQQTANSGPAELVGLQTDASAGALRPGRAGPQAGVNVDDILGWVEGRGADDASIGFATRRMAESGTIEQMVAFGIALRDVVRRVRRA